MKIWHILALSLVAGGALPALAQLTVANETRANAEARVRSHFALIDTDKDGYVTHAESAASVSRMMVDQRALAFDAIDSNHDGMISRAEFMAHRPGGARMDMPVAAAPLDADDGRIAIADVVKKVLARFDSADADHNGVLTPVERKAAHDARSAAPPPGTPR